MPDCENSEMRDLLPMYALGTLASPDRARVGAHVVACGTCRAEVALLRTVHAACPAPTIDVARIVAALPRAGVRPAVARASDIASLDAHRARRAAARAPRPWNRLAAVAAVLVGVVTVGVIGTRAGDAPHDARAVAPLGGGAVATASARPGASRTVSDLPVKGESARAVPRAGRTGATRPATPTVRAADALGTLGGVTSDVSDDELDALLAGLDSLSGIPVVEESEAIDVTGGDA